MKTYLSIRDERTGEECKDTITFTKTQLQAAHRSRRD